MTTLKHIAESIPNIIIKGDSLQTIKGLSKLDSSLSKEDLCWCTDLNIECLKTIKTGNIICNKSKIESLCVIVSNEHVVLFR